MIPQASSAPAPAPHATWSPARSRLAPALLLLVTLLVYLRSLGNGFVFDDEVMILANRYLGDWSFLWKSLTRDMFWYRDPLQLPQSVYWRPVLLIWQGLNYRLFGLDPRLWHAATLALHLVVVMLVFRVAIDLTADRARALLAAALFALTPIHVEAVVWEAAASFVIGAAFELAAFDSFVRRRSWILTTALFALALLDQESAVVFPALIGLYVFFRNPRHGLDDSHCRPSSRAGSAPLRAEAENPDGPARDSRPAAENDYEAGSPDSSPVLPFSGQRLAGGVLGRRIAAALLATAPFVLEVAIYLVLRRLVLGVISQPYRSNHMTLAQLLMTMPRALIDYLALLLMPWMAAPAHPLPIVTSVTAPAFYLALAGLAVAAIGLALVTRRHPRRALHLFCLAWILVTLAPVMDLRALRQDLLVQDRFLFLPSVGFCIILADWVLDLASRGAVLRRAVSIATAALLLGYGLASFRAQSFWRDDLTLFTRCILSSPGAWDCHSNLGATLERRGDLAGAARELRISLALKPEQGAALCELGRLDARQRLYPEAIAELAEGLGQWPSAPASAYVLLAELYDTQGNETSAEAQLVVAQRLFDGPRLVAMARARIRVRHGDAPAAEAILQNLARHYPTDPEVWTNLGLVLSDEQHNPQALAAYERALGLAPRDPSALFFTARTLHAMGRDREALERCRQALALAPNDRQIRALADQLQRSLPP